MGALLAARNVWRYLRQPLRRREVTFYSEGPGDWPHLGPLLMKLIDDHGQHVSYCTSSERDPGLQRQSPHLSTFWIGSGTARTVLFRSLDARLAVMTMTDLNVFYLRRSSYPVEYVYVFHAINSTHMIYREDAFDAYDTILCVGDHHMLEIRERERRAKLPPKRLVEHGSSRHDALAAAATTRPYVASNPPTILVAPTWGDVSLVEACGVDLVRSLLAAGYHVCLRPHPMQWDRSEALHQLIAAFASDPAFVVDRSAHADDAFHTAALMVSDWSGAALEFSLALRRPVLWIDVPRKVRNPHYQDLGIEPIEVALRAHLGQTLEPSDASTAGSVIRAMLQSGQPADRDAIRARVLFNPGQSATAGAAAIMERLSAKTSAATSAG